MDSIDLLIAFAWLAGTASVIITLLGAAELFVKCRREGVRKVWINPLAAFLLIPFSLFLWRAADDFSAAAGYESWVDEVERYGIAEFAEYHASYFEESNGIQIENPEKFLTDNIGKYLETAKSRRMAGAMDTLLAVWTVLLLLRYFGFVTSAGFRRIFLKKAVPLHARYNREEAEITLLYTGMYGKDETLKKLPATSKNLAALGQFIVWQEASEQPEKDLSAGVDSGE